MPVYISLLRGINVRGQKCLRMNELRALYKDLALHDATTYLQSGNVVFSVRAGAVQQLAREIERGIADKFGHSVTVWVRDSAYFRNIVQNNPFANRGDIDPARLSVTFLSATAPGAALGQLSKVAQSPDEFEITGDAIYLYCPGGYGRTRLSNNFFERKLNLRATTRNWKTVNALDRMARDAERAARGA